ncbi:MAG: hypothetical protein WD271_12000 [Acidimicrobiia bacterium]
MSLIWWDRDVTGTSNIAASEGKGMWRYLDSAKRYLAGLLPAGAPKFFDLRWVPFERRVIERPAAFENP